MPYRLEPFTDVGLDEATLRMLIDEHLGSTRPRLARWWAYFRNAAEVGVDGRTRLAQESGLPARLSGRAGAHADDRATREIVIENDIAWRVQSMVDFIFGKPITILSTARDEATRRTIERVLDAAWERSGGIALLQDFALLGHVYGHVDLLVRASEDLADRAGTIEADPASVAESLWVEVVEPTRGIAVLDPSDYRRIAAYVLVVERQESRATRRAGLAPWKRGWERRARAIVEVHAATDWQMYDDERLVAEGSNEMFGGEVPVAHVQNTSQPFRYEGLGEVEPLVPLQDELNTRLSDRANRVTLQSFKMYLAKGLDGFDRIPVGPGQIWSTENPDASVQAFGGDSDSPSESAHILEIREAMDKASGVPPLASGVVRAKIGNLTSANALRITMLGLLAKTARKRVTYGQGIARACRLMLAALDHAGVLRTDPADRGVRIEWPDPLPADVGEQVSAARAKAELGVPAERVLAELGYAPTDPGITG